MEGRQLAAELAAIPLPDFTTGPPDTEAVVAGLGGSTAPAVAAVLAAADRASGLTGERTSHPAPDGHTVGAWLALAMTDQAAQPTGQSRLTLQLLTAYMSTVYRDSGLPAMTAQNN